MQKQGPHIWPIHNRIDGTEGAHSNQSTPTRPITYGSRTRERLWDAASANYRLTDPKRIAFW